MKGRLCVGEIWKCGKEPQAPKGAIAWLNWHKSSKKKIILWCLEKHLKVSETL